MIEVTTKKHIDTYRQLDRQQYMQTYTLYKQLERQINSLETVNTHTDRHTNTRQLKDTDKHTHKHTSAEGEDVLSQSLTITLLPEQPSTLPSLDWG